MIQTDLPYQNSGDFVQGVRGLRLKNPRTASVSFGTRPTGVARMRRSFIQDYLANPIKPKTYSTPKKQKLKPVQKRQKHRRDVITRDMTFEQGLKTLGFSDYRGYLNSKLWRKIREQVFCLKGRICFLCGNSADQVHHRKYLATSLNGSNSHCMEPCCTKCHHMIEFDIDGNKIPSTEVERYVQQHLQQDELTNCEVSAEFRQMFR